MAKVQGLASFLQKTRRLRKAAGPAVEAGLLKAGAIVTAEQKRLAPVDDGHLRDSIRYELAHGAKSGNRAVRITAGDKKAFYAGMVEFGTTPHKIRPKKAKVLQLGADEFVGGTVNHPGTAAQPFFFPGYRATRRKARAAIAKGVREQVNKAVK